MRTVVPGARDLEDAMRSCDRVELRAGDATDRDALAALVRLFVVGGRLDVFPEGGPGVSIRFPLATVHGDDAWREMPR